MSDSHRADPLIRLLLLFAVVLAVLAGLTYACSYLMPLILFYLLPFLLASLFVSSLMWLLVRRVTPESEKEDEIAKNGAYVSPFRFKLLAFVLPTFVALNLFAFGTDLNRPEREDVKGNIKALAPEWPGLDQVFRGMKTSWFKSSMFESLRDKANEPSRYDKSDIRDIMWLAVIFGGPGIFFLLVRNSDEHESDAFSKWLERYRSRVTRDLETLYEQQTSELGRREMSLRSELANTRKKLDEVIGEVISLKAKLEFGSQSTTVKVRQAKETREHFAEGILDQDLL